MVDRTDVLIVGAGPAGLAAAIVLARNQLRVTVCERSTLPRDKACGEGIMPTGVEHLKLWIQQVATRLLASVFIRQPETKRRAVSTRALV